MFAIIPEFIEHLPSKFGVIFKYVHAESDFHKQLVISSVKVGNFLTEKSSHGGKLVAC
jgi:hypothetical protein